MSDLTEAVSAVGGRLLDRVKKSIGDRWDSINEEDQAMAAYLFQRAAKIQLDEITGRASPEAQARIAAAMKQWLSVAAGEAEIVRIELEDAIKDAFEETAAVMGGVLVNIMKGAME